MKKILSAIAALTAAVMCASCAGSTDTAQEDSGKLKIYCSFYAMADFAEEIAQDKAEVVTLVPVGAEPHDWEPSVSDIKKLSDGGVFVYHGAHMEDWVDSVTANLDADKCVIAEASEGIEENAGDPHMWLNPENAKTEARNIYEAICAADPENTEYYRANFDSFAEEIDAVYNECKTQLAPFAGKKLVTSHEAYGYLCAEFGLSQEAVTGVHSEGEPSPARMAELTEMIKSEGIGAVFYESMEDRSVIDTLAKSAGVRALELNPFEGDSEGRGYVEIMRANLANIVKGLS